MKRLGGRFYYKFQDLLLWGILEKEGKRYKVIELAKQALDPYDKEGAKEANILEKRIKKGGESEIGY